MNQSDLAKVAAKFGVSASTAARNPITAEAHNASQVGYHKFTPHKMDTQALPSGRRLRQDGKPSMNKLEREWHEMLKRDQSFKDVRPQAKRYKLGNGIWYKPDFTGLLAKDGTETAWEVKGPHAFRGGFENLKVAASAWPEVRWILVWKEGGSWRQQVVLP